MNHINHQLVVYYIIIIWIYINYINHQLEIHKIRNKRNILFCSILSWFCTFFFLSLSFLVFLHYAYHLFQSWYLIKYIYTFFGILQRSIFYRFHVCLACAKFNWLQCDMFNVKFFFSFVARTVKPTLWTMETHWYSSFLYLPCGWTWHSKGVTKKKSG